MTSMTENNIHSSQSLHLKQVRGKQVDDEGEGDATKRWYVFHYNSKVVFWWDIFILLLSVYNSFTVPLSFAFEEYGNRFKRSPDPRKPDEVGD